MLCCVAADDATKPLPFFYTTRECWFERMRCENVVEVVRRGDDGDDHDDHDDKKEDLCGIV